MSSLTNICVFCGSNAGTDPAYRTAAQSLGKLIATRGSVLVYGGAKAGLMGVIADAALGAGGHVIGVMPRGVIASEIAHPGLTQLHMVGSMHERKALMEQLSDAFIAMPGGFGTLDEFFEILTWAQLGLHRKPCGIFNIAGYYDRLLGMLDHAMGEGFLKETHRHLLLSEDTPEKLLSRMAQFESPSVGKWITTPREP
jgi:uncharacterized protein (TIGR00730 family)